MIIDECSGTEHLPNNGTYMNHDFDFVNLGHKFNKVRKTKVSHGNAPLRGVNPVRRKGGHQIDESLILMDHLPPIPSAKTKK